MQDVDLPLPESWGRAIGPFVRVRSDRILLMDFGTSPTDAQFDAHFEEFGRWCDENRDPAGTLVVLRSLLAGVNAAQRKRLAEFEKRVEDHDRRYLKAAALVAPTALTRGLATAVFWLKPPVYRYQFFAHFTPALPWLEGLMSASKAA